MCQPMYFARYNQTKLNQINGFFLCSLIHSYRCINWWHFRKRQMFFVLVPLYLTSFFRSKCMLAWQFLMNTKNSYHNHQLFFPFVISSYENGWKLSIEGNVGKIRVKRVCLNEMKKTTFEFTLRNQHLNIRYIYLLLHICMWFARFQMKIYVVVFIYFFFLFSYQTQITEKHLWRINSMENSW